LIKATKRFLDYDTKLKDQSVKEINDFIKIEIISDQDLINYHDELVKMIEKNKNDFE
jgi:predicted DNA-binding ArsR family transcriptional regulator